MKKILYINVTYKNASTGRIIKDIVSSPKAQNIEYRVLFQEGNNADGIGIQFENKIENIIRRGVHKFFGNVELVTVSETKRLIKEIKKFNPDLIHIHTIHHQCTNYKLLFDFLKEYNKPVIYTIHDCWAYTGGCYHYTSIGCNGFLNGCENCPKSNIDLDCDKTKTAYNLNYKKSFYDSKIPLVFTGVSEWIASEAKKSIVNSRLVYTIRNGVDTDIFKNLKSTDEVKKMREKLLEGRKYLVLGVASYWSENKGLSTFKRLAEFLGDDYIVILVGSNLPENSNINNLKYYGRTDSVDTLCNIYNSADILCNMSIEETFGLVTAEAACCGTPVIAYDSTANSEVISLAHGTLIKKDNETEMFEKIKQICESESQLDYFEEVRHSLSKQRMIDEYWALYEKLLNEEERR